MQITLRRAVLAVAVALALAIGSVSLPGVAQARPAENGLLSVSGDEGELITGGKSYSYSTSDGSSFDVTGETNNSEFHLQMSAANGDVWHLDLAAPQGHALVPGPYTGAVRYPSSLAGVPAIALDGNGHICRGMTGSFTVLNATFGPFGYVQTFDATYEAHCQSGEPAVRGEVHIQNPAPPTLLDFDIVISTSGIASTLNGTANVHGTVTCNKDATFNLDGTVFQVVKRTLIRGTYSTQLVCIAGQPVDWTARVRPTSTTPFQKGDAEVTTQASGFDADYDNTVSVTEVATVKLAKG